MQLRRFTAYIFILQMRSVFNSPTDVNGQRLVSSRLYLQFLSSIVPQTSIPLIYHLLRRFIYNTEVQYVIGKHFPPDSCPVTTTIFRYTYH